MWVRKIKRKKKEGGGDLSLIADMENQNQNLLLNNILLLSNFLYNCPLADAQVIKDASCQKHPRILYMRWFNNIFDPINEEKGTDMAMTFCFVLIPNLRSSLLILFSGIVLFCWRKQTFPNKVKVVSSFSVFFSLLFLLIGWRWNLRLFDRDTTRKK